MANEDDLNNNDDLHNDESGAGGVDDGQQQGGDNNDGGASPPAQKGRTLDEQLSDFLDKSSRPQGRAEQSKAAGSTPQGQRQQQGAGQQPGARGNAGQGNEGAGGRQQIQPPATPARTFGTMFRSDRQGNIFTAEGELIAKAGAGHNLFRKLYPYIENASQEAQSFKSRLDAYERADGLAHQAGLSLEERAAAINLMVAFKKNPATAVNFLLDQAQARGIDVSAIRGGQSFDMSAFETVIANKLAEAFKPYQFILDDRQMFEQQRESSDAAAQQYNEFMESYPDAKMHENAIASVMDAKMKQGSPVSVTEAYWMLKADASSRGLDWTKPLAPQYQVVAQRTQQNGGGNGQRQPTMPNMSGRGGTPGSANGIVDATVRREASVDESWNDIVGSVMREHGFAH